MLPAYFKFSWSNVSGQYWHPAPSPWKITKLMEHMVNGERWWVLVFEPKGEDPKGIIHEEGKDRFFSDEWLFSIEGWKALEEGKNNEILEQNFFYHGEGQMKQEPKESRKSLSLKIFRIYWTKSWEPYLTEPDSILHRKVCWVIPYHFLVVKRFFFCSDETAIHRPFCVFLGAC